LASLKLSLEKDSDEVDSEVLFHEVNKIESVINALFELSRVENSSSSNFTELDLEDAARLSVTSFINHHNLENIELSFNVQTAKPTIIRCSQALFDILIKNLIENAIKALKAKADDSKKAIEISIANNNLIVKDNGIGIGKNNFNSLLYQQKNKGFNSGLKLGLNIVKKICDLSDGIISAETINNETFFSISFKSVSIS
jgi:signal transduction histidine kinase